MTITGSQLAVSHSNIGIGQRESSQGTLAWREPQVHGLLDVTRPVVNETGANQLKINQFKIESSTMSVAATGSIKDLIGRQHVELGGMMLMNWEQLTRLLSPSSGSMLKLTGGGPQPFAIRGSFGSSRTADDSVTVPLPDSWQAPSPQRSKTTTHRYHRQHARVDGGVETWLPASLPKQHWLGKVAKLLIFLLALAHYHCDWLRDSWPLAHLRYQFQEGKFVVHRDSASSFTG